MTVTIESWGDERAILGEGIIWDQRRGRLFWLDIKRAKLFETSPDVSGAFEWTIVGDIGPTIGCIAVDPETDGFLAASAFGLVRLRCNDQARIVEAERLADPERDLPHNRFNDGAVDPLGGFWAGTMDDREETVSGSWWRWDGKHAVRQLGGFKVTNGPVFVGTEKAEFQVFLTDSAEARVYKASYNLKRGLFDIKVWAEFDPLAGYPDGMCIDRDGRLWIAFWDGAAIRAYDPWEDRAGEPLAMIALPVQRPTKLAFTPAGDCFVTSATVESQDTKYDRDLNGVLLKIGQIEGQISRQGSVL